MKTPKLLLNTTGRGCLWGLFFGIILSFVYLGLVVTATLPYSGAIASPSSPPPPDSGPGIVIILEIGAALYLGIVIILLGLGNGLLIGIITRIFFPASNFTPRYGKICMLASGFFGTIIGLLVFNFAFGVLSWDTDGQEIISRVVFLIAPAIAAGLATTLSGQRLARWYETEMQKQSS